MNKRLFSKFLLVGIINTIIGLSAMLLFLRIGFSYWSATCIGNLIGACTSYTLNRLFTFNSQKPVTKTILRFTLVVSVCYVFAYTLGKNLSIWLLNQFLLAPPTLIDEIAILIGTVLYTIFNYVGQKQFVF